MKFIKEFLSRNFCNSVAWSENWLSSQENTIEFGSTLMVVSTCFRVSIDLLYNEIKIHNTIQNIRTQKAKPNRRPCCFLNSLYSKICSSFLFEYLTDLQIAGSSWHKRGRVSPHHSKLFKKFPNRCWRVCLI